MDEKKIEKAASGYSKTLRENQTLSFAYRDFKAGAHWAIQEFMKELWHNAEEEPNKSKSDILTLGFDTDDAYLQFKDSILWQDESWRHSISRCRINQWAYLSDILPKQKGGEG